MAGLELFQRHRAAFLDGQAQVEGLLNFIKERVALEESYSKSLLKLSKHTLSIDEKTTEPTIFEALASVRGDVANESVQHTELASSLQRDVLDPLIRLRDGGEAVHKLSTQTKQAAKDMKAAYEKCRKLYSKYVQLHNKAVGACSTAGIPSPSMWIPPSSSSSNSSSTNNTMNTATTTPGTTPNGNNTSTDGSTTLTRSPTFTYGNANGSGNNSTITSSTNSVSVIVSSSSSASSTTVSLTSNHESSDSSMNTIPVSFTSPLPARNTGTFITPPPTVTTGVMTMNSEGGIHVQLLGEQRTTGTITASSLTHNPPNQTISNLTTATPTPFFMGIDSDESVTTPSSTTDGIHSTANPIIDRTPSHDNDVSSNRNNTVRLSDNSVHNLDSMEGIIHVEETNSIASDQHNSTADSILHQQYSGSVSQTNIHTNGGNRRRSIDEGSEGSFASLGDPNASFADRLRSMASGLIGSAMAVPPTTAAATAASNMTTEERIAAIKAAAVAAIGLADEACRECQEAWIQHGKTKEVFQRQLTASMVIFTEIEKKRVAELSDSLRKYAVFISSLHANLQYDVQRLSGKVEEIANAPATTLTSLSAWKEQEQQQLLAQQLQAQQDIEQLQQIETFAVTTPMLNSLPEAIRRTSILDMGLSSTASTTTTSTTATTATITRSLSTVNGMTTSSNNVPIERSVSNRSVGIDSPSSPPTFSKIGSRVLNAIPSVASLGSFGTQTSEVSGTLSSSSTETPLTPTTHTATVPIAVSSIVPSTGTTSIGSSFVSSTAALFMNTASITSPGPSSNTIALSHDPNGDPSKSSVSMSRLFGGTTRTNKPATSSPLVPRPNSDPASVSTPERSTPADITSPNGQLGAMMKGMLGSFGLSTGNSSTSKTSISGTTKNSSSANSSSTLTPSSGGHPPLKPKQSGMSVSVSVLGSVRNQGIAGVGTKGTKEVAAMMEHLHIERGPIEFLVESLFDPTARILKLSTDGTTITLELPNLQSSGDSDAENTIPSLSLADFASGKSTPQSPTSGRSRVGTAASLSVETTDDRASPSLPDNIRRSPIHDGLNDTRFGPLSTSFATPQRDTLAHANTYRTSPAVLNGELNSATLILLPRAKKLLQSAPDGLSRLVIALDSRRGESPVLTRPSFDALSTILLVALNIAESRSDFARARALMVISQTFYCHLHADEDADTIDSSVRAAASPEKVSSSDGSTELSASTAATNVTWTGQSHSGLSPDHRVDTSFITHSKSLVHTPEQAMHGTDSNNPSSSVHPNSNGRSSRLYLQTRVKQHSLWQNMSYWESAVYDSVGSEISKMPTDTKPESKGREQDIIFGQLGFFAYNMISFGVPVDSVRKLVDKYARFIHLDTHHMALLMASMETFTKQ